MCVCGVVCVWCGVCVWQAINADLVPYLLELLERDLTECDKPSATKAIIAESLKLMAKDLANGEKVCVCEFVCSNASVCIVQNTHIDTYSHFNTHCTLQLTSIIHS